MEKIKAYFSSKFYATTIDIYLLGLCISMGALTFPWNFAMRTHFYEFLTGMILSTVMYGCLILCVSEMMSALPFSGGIYGLARVALSPYIGFLVGILETLKNVFHITCCVQPLSRYVAAVLHDNLAHQPIYWILILGSTGLICIFGGRIFWNFNRLMGLTCLALTLMYLCTPMINKTDFKLYGNTNLFFQPVDTFDSLNMFRYAPVATWFYIGIEIIPFTCIDSKTATKSVPYALLATYVTVVIFSFGVYTAACSQFPGAFRLQFVNLPMMFGYADMLGLTYEHACWFPITCIFGSVFAFMFGCGRQISSLSSSKLLPSFLQWKTMYSETPYMAIVATCVFCFFVLCLLRYKLNDDISLLFYICAVGSYFSYISVFVTYIQFKRKYITLKREFFNPLGIYSAIVGILICLLLSACLLGLTKGTKVAAVPITLAIVLGLGSVYYFTFAAKTQYYSEEEQKAFLITYVINNNKRGRKKISKGGKGIGGFLSFRSTSESSMSVSTTARKYLAMISVTNRSANIKSIHTPDDYSVLSKDVESNLGSVTLANELNPYKEEELDDSDPSIENQTKEKPVENVRNLRNSIDFSHLPSLDVLKHMHEEVEMQEHPEQAQSIKNKEQALDYLPHTPGLTSMKIIPDHHHQSHDVEAN